MRKSIPLASVGLGALLLLAGGCMHFCHPLSSTEEAKKQGAHTLPEYARNRVYIAFFDGFDPLAVANLEGVRDQIQKLGFIKTYYGQVYNYWEIRAGFREVHEDQPDARFVVIGYSIGAHPARQLCLDTVKDGIAIDSLIYLDAYQLEETEASKPPNVERMSHVVSVGPVLGSKPFEGAENVHIDWRHHGVPTHPKTLDHLTRELVASALRVPVIHNTVPKPYDISPKPHLGREPAPADMKEPGEWDFLKLNSPAGIRGTQPGRIAHGEPGTIEMLPGKPTEVPPPKVDEKK